MRNVIEQLEDKRSLLVMYEAGELAPADRAQVERMLATDAELRRVLDELRAAQQSVGAGLAQLDQTEPLPGASAAAAARQFGRAARQWHGDRLARAKAQPKQSRRLPWWSYPLSTAAAITLAAVLWWWTLPPAPTELRGAGGEVAVMPPENDPSVSDNSAQNPQFAGLDSMEDSRSRELADVERELLAIQSLRENWQ